MKIFNIILLSFTALFVASSCTIKHTISYNDDMSGSSEILVDYGDFLSQMGSLMGDSADLEKDMSLQESLGDLDETFKGIKGLSNVKSIQEPKEGIMGFSFDFEDTKGLNQAMNNYLADDTKIDKKASSTFTQKKKKLLINYDDQDLGGLKESLGDESMMFMLASFDYEFTVNLPKPIKKIDNKAYILSADRKTISQSINLEDYFSGKENLSAKIKW